ncbi:MAG: hypothetical protein JNK38_22350, partial [Acidobacteria bacterium]|nr:hypothetical protein [Acidobacteriota bacterium]
MSELSSQTVQSEQSPRQSKWRLTPQMRRDARLVGMVLAIKAVCMLFAVQSFHVWADKPVGGWRGWLE